MDAKLNALIERLEATTVKLENLSGSSIPGNIIENIQTISPSVVAYDEIIEGALKLFLSTSKQIGGLVNEHVFGINQALLFEIALIAQKDLLIKASKSRVPDKNTLQSLLKPLECAIANVVALKEKNRPSPFYDHLSVVADGVPALGWVLVAPAPAPYINDFKEASSFYTFRVIKAYKEKDPSHVAWANSYTAILVDVAKYVKKYHTTGLVWNIKGDDLSCVSKTAATEAISIAPLSTAAQIDQKTCAQSVNIMDELAKGTNGLRKVDKSEMTHKNPELRASSLVKAGEVKQSAQPSPKIVSSAKNPPKLALEGNKWIVENYNLGEVVVDKTEIRHVVYIYNCQNTTIKIAGKVNAITIDQCKNVGVLVDNVVSTLDTVNSQRVQIQINGKCPTANVDKTDGLQLYLSKESESIQFLSAKSSEMNILILNDQGEFTEMAVGEQFKTIIKGGKLVTEAVESLG